MVCKSEIHGPISSWYVFLVYVFWLQTSTYTIQVLGGPIYEESQYKTHVGTHVLGLPLVPTHCHDLDIPDPNKKYHYIR